MRRLGSHKSDTPGEKRKRGWGASRTSRQDSSENIDVSSNSLKVIYNMMNNICVPNKLTKQNSYFLAMLILIFVGISRYFFIAENFKTNISHLYFGY